jgi:predicted nucleic acid-binding protein
MTADVFYDTNVILYLLSADAAKADRAEEILAAGGHVSVQVLNEIAAVASRKLSLGWLEIGEILEQVRAVCTVEAVTVQTHEHGLALASRHGLHVYDAMIVASALLSGCKVLHSEDLQDGQVFDRQLTVRNPFR